MDIYIKQRVLFFPLASNKVIIYHFGKRLAEGEDFDIPWSARKNKIIRPIKVIAIYARKGTNEWEQSTLTIAKSLPVQAA